MDPAKYRPAPGEIPTDPGVYRFVDHRDVVIYVGKAKNLRSRLNSYFSDVASLHPRTQAMVTSAVRVSWTVVSTEVEALQLEYAWIKEHDPRFNVKYRDDKSYPLLAVTMSEEFPRAYVTRGTKRAGTKYFGPYAHAWAIRDTVDTLLRVFPIRTCSGGVFQRAGRSGRPCLLGYIEKCSAPCVGRIDASEHRVLVDRFNAFMAGDSQGVIANLRLAMKQAAAQLDFETAARRRDDIGALERVLERNAVVLADGCDADVFALHADDLEASLYGFHVRGGRIRGQRGWVVDRGAGNSMGELMAVALQQIYGDVEADAVPREVLVSHLPDQIDTVRQWLSQKRGANVDVRTPQRGDKRAFMHNVAQNASHALALHKTRRASDLNARSAALQDLQQALSLPEAPLRIECVDISTLMGTQTVGSLVVFEDGLPRKSDYRHFIVRDENAASDVGAVYEVVTRRFRRLEVADETATSRPPAQPPAVVAGATAAPNKRRSGFAYRPQLLLIDGGAPQVAAAQQALTDCGVVDLPVVGLAKRLEEVWLPDDEFPVILPRGAAALYLLQQIRDEAHRFAISHHRKRRSRSAQHSALDDIPGIGPARRATLLEAFGSVKGIRSATVADVSQLKGFTAELAERVLTALSVDPAQTPAVNVTTGEMLDDHDANP